MDSQNILIFAKQGDVNAIALLMNNSLKDKHVIAKVTKKDDCLQVILESLEVPSQEILVSTIRNGLMSLAPESISRVKVYARQSEDSPVVWSERFSLNATETPKTLEFTPPMSAEASQNLKKEAQKIEKQINFVFWGFLIFLFGGCTIVGALSSNSGNCYEQAGQDILRQEGNKTLNMSDVERYQHEMSSRCH